ncbi:WD40 [Musa troglodytarum]|uniref:WD40 n=1 Tax=Musa troglodytarum TaxID=320322 RepID=A0A9E7FZR1_9LILI|nr:WD40 [Musa troglodytarum]
MDAMRFIKKVLKQHTEENEHTLSGLAAQVTIHYGIPYTASILAFDPIQRLLAIGTLDGRIKVIGGDNIEGLLICPKKVPYKYLEFLHNQGFLVAITNENEVQVWNLELRQLVHCFQWEANVTAFSVIYGTYLMYIGDENGLLSVLKYDEENGELLKLPYQLPANAVAEAAGISIPDIQSIVGILPQPGTSSTRVLVAYEKGLLILWDIHKGQAVTTRGHTNLQLKGVEGPDSLSETSDQLQSNAASDEGDNEICCLCWVSTNGSIAAVGYINGDILLWDFSSSFSVKGQQPQISSSNVIKLQLASGDRRLPVIVLHWSANCKGNIDKGGQLFIYGGDEIGSEEVLAVLTLEWSSGVETVKCISRVDLNLNGSFADMILIPDVGASDKNSTAALFVLTNPGQINVYDGAVLSVLKSEGNHSAQAENFPVVVPTIDPRMTVAKLCLLSKGSSASKVLFKKFYARTTRSSTLSAGTKWPLTGGVPPEMSYEDHEVAKLFIAGYQDGSLRIWDATYPILGLMFVLEGKLPVIQVDGAFAAVSAVALCPLSMTLAVGDERGLVRIYKLQENTNGSSFQFVTETNHEVHIIHHGQGFHCIAAFSILNSPVRDIHFTNSGSHIAAGFESGQVLMLDMTSLSVLFRTDCASGTNSAVISASMPSVSQYILQNWGYYRLQNEGSVSASKAVAEPEKCSQNLPDEPSSQSGPERSNTCEPSKTKELQGCRPEDAPYHCETLIDPLLVLCFADSLCLYPLKSVIEGNSNFFHKVNLAQRICWSTVLKVDAKAPELILLFEAGTIEIRCLPGLEIKVESSLMSVLRWSFKTNMDKTMSSSDDGLIALVNGCEVAFISFLDDQSRFTELMPCLHDKVLASATAAALNHSIDLKKRQMTAPGIFGGIIKGLKGGRTDIDDIVNDGIPSYSSAKQLEQLFSRFPFSDQSTTIIRNEEVGELSIDDIEIDDPLPAPSTSTTVTKSKKKDEEKEREKLFQGSTKDSKPRMRTPQEILTQYRFAGDASAAAAHAREKLVQRQEKLERISQHTEELQNNAESFAAMAHELAKTMENKKWWKI